MHVECRLDRLGNEWKVLASARSRARMHTVPLGYTFTLRCVNDCIEDDIFRKAGLIAHVQIPCRLYFCVCADIIPYQAARRSYPRSLLVLDEMEAVFIEKVRKST